MENLQPASVDASELPEGFTTSSPSAVGGSNEQKDRDDQKQAILEQALTAEALARLRRIKIVKPEKAAQVENVIASMAKSGKLPGRITEGKLIEMLERGNASGARKSSNSISIQRKNYGMDSDDEDDNDEDLM